MKDNIILSEILGFLLFSAEKEAAGFSVESAAASWRAEKDTRESWRHAATDFAGIAKAAGLSIRLSGARKYEKFLDELQTVPSHKAYDLENEAEGSPPAVVAGTTA